MRSPPRAPSTQRREVGELGPHLGAGDLLSLPGKQGAGGDCRTGSLVGTMAHFWHASVANATLWGLDALCFGYLCPESAKWRRSRVEKCNTNPELADWRLAKELLACPFWGCEQPQGLAARFSEL